MTFNVVNELSLICELEVVTEGAQVEVAVQVTSEEEGLLQKITLRASIT